MMIVVILLWYIHFFGHELLHRDIHFSSDLYVTDSPLKSRDRRLKILINEWRVRYLIQTEL